MLTTRATTLLRIRHPVVLGGMSTGTSPELVAAVSDAGGLGIQGCAGRPPAEIAQLAGAIRRLTDRPFGLNLLLFMAGEAAVATVLATRPAVFSTAWARAQQDLDTLFARAHEIGALVMHMVSTLPEAERAVAAGADIIVAQGTDGGGHVGQIGTIVLTAQVTRAVAPVPVLAAGGIADGAGLAAALMLGAEGALLGTRFLATQEAPVPDSFKHLITRSDGHDTLLTEIPDVASGTVWPGAYARAFRTRRLEEWLGREGELRYHQTEVADAARQARAGGDAEGSFVLSGQSAGLIDAVEPAGLIVERIVQEAETLLRDRAAALLGTTGGSTPA